MESLQGWCYFPISYKSIAVYVCVQLFIFDDHHNISIVNILLKKIILFIFSSPDERVSDWIK